MITLLGVGHVFDIAPRVREAILVRRPRVVALELDPTRFQALMSRGHEARGLSFLHAVAHLESRIARQYGVRVGDEMVAAARAARETGSEIVFIDRDSRDTLLRAWRAMPIRERLRFLVSLFQGAFVAKARVESELRRYQEDEAGVIGEFAEELPTMKRVLIDERDGHMAARLRETHAAKGDVVAVIGDGHIAGVLARLAGESVEVVRLKELREPRVLPGATAQVTYHL